MRQCGLFDHSSRSFSWTLDPTHLEFSCLFLRWLTDLLLRSNFSYQKKEEVHFHFWRRNMLVCRLQGASGGIDRRARPPERPPPSPTAATPDQMHDDELFGAERVLLRIRNFDLTGMGSSGNYSPFSPSCFFNQFCLPFFSFLDLEIGKLKSLSFFLLLKPTRIFFATASREPLLFAS